MPLLNYTTSINVDKTVSEIQKALARAGANSILSEYDGGFRLPADWRPVLYLLQHDRNVPKKLQTEEQAIRVSWRIIKDWVEAQLAIIATQMVKPEQAFLPYMLSSGGKTVYEVFADNPQLLLGGSNA